MHAFVKTLKKSDMAKKSPADEKTDFVVIGQIHRPHGVHGKLRVEPLTDEPERFKRLDRVFIRFQDERRSPFKVQQVQIANNYIILSLEGVSSRDEAERFRKAYIEIPRQECLPLPEGAYYYFELINLDVVTREGRRIGKVADIVSYPANDVFVVKSDNEQEYLIPDIPDVIDKIDMEQHRIIINPIEGLLDI